MSANKELLRERLSAIMSYEKKTKKAGILTIGLTTGDRSDGRGRNRHCSWDGRWK